jgi:hypothetical protein
MHGSAWQGDGAGLLLALADRIGRSKEVPAGSAEADEFVGGLTCPPAPSRRAERPDSGYGWSRTAAVPVCHPRQP